MGPMPGKRKPRNHPLDDYRKKRAAEATPEPFSGETAQRPGLFVIHKHAARRLHYDLRLEMGGVLQSWAVPKGPSLDPDEKRLAMKVEDHPMEYADFEGMIPKGNYGAGAVIIWDRGLWIPIGDSRHGLEKGKLLFDLRGYKLRGRWTLFRTKRSPKDWLLVKKPDAYADREGSRPPAEESVLSNLTVEDLQEGRDPARRIRERLGRLRAPRGDLNASRAGVMLAEPRERPFTREGWIFELKYDGFRLVAAREGKQPSLRYRRGRLVTGTFPEIAAAVAALPYENLVLDGEVVVLDEQGRPSFERLQQRVHLTRRADIQQACVRLPATLFVFDLLGLEGFDLRSLPLIERKKVLATLLPAVGPLRYSDHIETRGEEMFEQVLGMRLEGIVAKRADSRYRAGRSSDWIKIRADRTGDFAVVGFSPPKGSRAGFGALHLAVRAGTGLRYAGRVGAGFTARQVEEIRGLLEGSSRPDPPCEGVPASEKGQAWVEPSLVCEVRFKEWTRAGHLRHPVFLRLREDKGIEDCDRNDPPRLELRPAIASEAPPPGEPSLTNLGKVFWPVEGYTKGDLIHYYRAIAPWLLPYLKDRPVVLTRYPDGIEGKSFFQKDAPKFVPEWIHTETMWSEHAGREIHYFICDDERTLVYLANLGTIPLHIWSSRLQTLQSPDWCILDLDPKKAPFTHVVEVAREIRALCEEIDLECFVKTTGSSGLHVLIPLGGQLPFKPARILGQLLARLVVERLPRISTTARALGARKGRVYIDCLQNGHGKLLVSPFSARPLPGATVSTPLRWSEVTPGLDIGRFTIRTVPRRVSRMPEEPLLPVLRTSPDLARALTLLEGKLGG